MLVNDHLPRTFPDLFLPLPAPQFATTTAEILTHLAPGEHNTLLQETLRLFRLPEVLHTTSNLQQEEILIFHPSSSGMEDETYGALNSPCLQHKEDSSQIEEEMPRNVIIRCTRS